MTRLINAFEQMLDGSGDPVPSGLIDFFESGSSSARKTTFADSAQTIPNANPVVLGGDGRCPNVFGTGSYNAILRTAAGVQILARDPVGQGGGLTFGDDWSSTREYSATDQVRDAGTYWQSLVSGNLGNQPSLDSGAKWIKTDFTKILVNTSSIVTNANAIALKYDKTGGALSGQATSTAGDFNLVTNTALSNAAATLTAAQLIGGEFTITPSVARIQTLDTAANIISALSGSVDNSNFTFTIVNLAAFDVTIATAAGVTLVGNMIVNDGSATFRVRRLNASTVSVTRIESGSTTATSQIMIVRDEKSNGTDGGTFTSGAWRTRDLNDVLINTITGASLASDRITLPAGIYKIAANASAFDVNSNVAKIANITDSSDEVIGSTEKTSGTNNTGKSFIVGVINITSTKVFEIQHRCQSTKSTNGFGLSSSFGVVEIYTAVSIEKIG
jgi:hypothetical protein